MREPTFSGPTGQSAFLLTHLTTAASMPPGRLNGPATMASFAGTTARVFEIGRKSQMSKHGFKLFAVGAILSGSLVASASAFAQTPAHVRGTIEAAPDHELTVQTNRGKTETIKLAENAGV